MKRILLAIMCVLLMLLAACDDGASVIVKPTPMSATATPAATPAATPEVVPTLTPVAEPTQITVMAVGDMLCLGAQLSAARSGSNYNFDYAFDEVKDIISSADLAVCNLETLIAEGYPYTKISSSSTSTPSPTTSVVDPDTGGDDEGGGDDGGAVVDNNAMADITVPEYSVQLWEQILPVGPLVNGPDSFLSAVVGAGFDVLTIANNHINDYGPDGLQKTIKRLDGYGVHHTGAYAAAEDKAPLIVDVQGIRIGFVAYTDHLNTYKDLQEELFDLYVEDRMVADIAKTNEAGADFTIFYMHWGTENTHELTDEQRSIAQAAADAGADLILGSHPHCVQQFDMIETAHGSVPVIYSLGNFVSSMARDINKDGMILKFTLEKEYEANTTTIKSLSYIPTICTSYDDKRFVVLPADAASASGSTTRTKSRERTIDILGSDVAAPE